MAPTAAVNARTYYERSRVILMSWRAASVKEMI